jgi:hypothetical protein
MTTPPQRSPRPHSTVPPAPTLEVLIALGDELLDAHLDTIGLAAELPDVAWRAHVDYLRALQRAGRGLLARSRADESAA